MRALIIIKYIYKILFINVFVIIVTIADQYFHKHK